MPVINFKALHSFLNRIQHDISSSLSHPVNLKLAWQGRQNGFGFCGHLSLTDSVTHPQLEIKNSCETITLFSDHIYYDPFI